MSKSHLGHVARKRFGQNFLFDEQIIDQIVSIIAPAPEQNLVEIGPGLAALTEPVADLAGKLTVVELDKDLAARLQSHPFLQEKLSIIQADALKYDFAQLAQEQPLRVFGNLPYNISTPLLFHLFKYCDKVQDMHFMLQKEVVDRLAATPGHKNYGRLSVMAQYHCQVTPALMVPPHAFKPAPKVDSAIVRLVPHKQPPVALDNPDHLHKICSAAFNQRRKTLRNSLKDFLSEAVISDLGIDPKARAETLSLQQFALLANAYTPQQEDPS